MMTREMMRLQRRLSRYSGHKPRMRQWRPHSLQIGRLRIPTSLRLVSEPHAAGRRPAVVHHCLDGSGESSGGQAWGTRRGSGSASARLERDRRPRHTGLDRKTVRRHIGRGLEPPAYPPRTAGPTKVAPFQTYRRERAAAYPELTASRLRRELGKRGYDGGCTAVKDYLRSVRPRAASGFELRFEAPPGWGEPGRGGRMLPKAVHDVTVHNLTWRALPAAHGNWNSVRTPFWRLSRSGMFEAFSDCWPRPAGQRAWRRCSAARRCGRMSRQPGQKRAARSGARALAGRVFLQDTPQNRHGWPADRCPSDRWQGQRLHSA